MRYFVFAMSFSLFVLVGCNSLSGTQPESISNANYQPKNVIMVVSDGMGPAFTTAYRNYRDDPTTAEVERVIFDDIFVGNASTYPAKESGFITDSAASATALATGVKSYNGAIGVDVKKRPVTSILQRAKAVGMKTGIVVTSQIVHATPASYMVHNESRQNYNDIADSYFDDRVAGEFVANVMLGGGTNYFEREDRDITAQFIDAGYEYADTYNRLASVPAGSNVLGLFAPVGLPWVLDDTRKNRLAYMTQHAIKHLQNDEGFFLLVEASQVDWAGHSNDIASAMGEMHDLNLAVEYLYNYVQSHPDTLVVITADHSTGGLAVGARGDYRWSPEWLQKLSHSPTQMAVNLPEVADPVDYISSAVGFSLTEQEAENIRQLAEFDDPRERESGIKSLLDMRSNTGWTTTGHTGVDVEVFAFGAGKEAFLGQYDNTDIAKKLFGLLREPNNASMPEKQTSSATPQTSGDTPCDFMNDWRCN